jgi:hypothetical protein
MFHFMFCHKYFIYRFKEAQGNTTCARVALVWRVGNF